MDGLLAEESRMKQDHLVSALVEKRADIASLMLGLEKRLSAHRAALVHLDATLKLLDPTIKICRNPFKAPDVRALGILRAGRAFAAVSRRGAYSGDQRHFGRRTRLTSHAREGARPRRRKDALGFYPALSLGDGQAAPDSNRAAHRQGCWRALGFARGRGESLKTRFGKAVR
jgi:hypothetical protein